MLKKGNPAHNGEWGISMQKLRRIFPAARTGQGPWQFVIYGLGFDAVSASIYRVRQDENLEKDVVPINGKNMVARTAVIKITLI